MENDWMELFYGVGQITEILEVNKYTEQFGLYLTEAEATILVMERKESLRKQERIEFGESILPKLLFSFCDSAYLYQYNYADTMCRLQEMFYEYKNECMDEVTDDELIQFMRKSFEGECQGDLDRLEDTCLELFARRQKEHGTRFGFERFGK